VALKIHHKLTILFCVIFAAVTLGIFIFLYQTLREHTYHRIQDNLRKSVAFAEMYVREKAPHITAPQGWDTLADSIGSVNGLRATIIARDGTVLGDSDLTLSETRKVDNHRQRPEVDAALRTGFGMSRRYSTTIGTDMLYMARTFDSGPHKGIIRLALPLSEIGYISDELKKPLAVSLAIALIVAVLSAFLTSFFFSRRIAILSRAAKKIATGDFSRRIHLSVKDVLGDLADSINDMSAQVRSRIEEVGLEKSRLEAVLLSMVEGVLVVDPQGKVLLINAALKEFLHIEGNPAGRNTLEVIRNADVQENISETLARGPGVYSSEISLLYPEEIILLVHATKIIREEKLDGILLVFHNITELRRLEQVRKEFAANVSHELRTPVASIKGYAETLLDGALEDKENARDFVEIIYKDTDRLIRLINDILDLSQIESGRVDMNCAPLKIEPIAEKALAAFRKDFHKKNVVIKKRFPGQLPAVLANEDRIGLVFSNLIDNALKYTPSGGTITVSAAESGDKVLIEIKDTGMGIPDKEISRIFERFYRVDKARSRELGGTGLGLSIVKHIVQAHGGDIFVESRPDQGSTFGFTLPQA